jgi:vacuolar protein sorting-associated protein 41
VKLLQRHDLTTIMAAESEDQGEGKDQLVDDSTSHEADTVDEDETEGRDSDTEEGEVDEDDEPKLKYARMTGHLGSVYRNGDATSAFLVAGDKMVRP